MKSLFSFKGRARRLHYWLTSLAVAAIAVLLVVLQLKVLGTIGGALSLLIIIPVVWISFAVGVRRLHDREKPWWWVLIFFVLPSALTAPMEQLDETTMPSTPVLVLGLMGVAIGIWGLIELGFLPGTRGENRYGPDPKA
jgi:uncharacterized membrane protein YhaH (DUF805 family)